MSHRDRPANPKKMSVDQATSEAAISASM